jgi:uncharacterized cupredoxin-like copper-binding protein
MDSKQKIAISVIVGVIVLGVIGYFAITGNYKDILKYKGQQGEEQQIRLENGDLETAVVVAPGTSAVTENGKVVNINTGKLADNKAPSGTPGAPQQSNPVSKAEIPASVVKITAFAGGFTPNSFEVRSGDPVSLSVTAGDDKVFVFAFDDVSLAGVRVGVGPGIDRTRIIVFNAPTQKGEYTFYSDVPGQRGAGLVGKMIVK